MESEIGDAWAALKKAADLGIIVKVSNEGTKTKGEFFCIEVIGVTNEYHLPDLEVNLYEGFMPEGYE